MTKQKQPTATERLTELEEEAAEAKRCANRARTRVRNEWEVGKQVLRPFTEPAESVRFTEHHPVALKRMTADLIATVQERGLAFDLEPGTRVLTVIDPEARLELREAVAARAKANQAVSEFKREDRKQLAREADEAKKQRVRDALDGDASFEELKRALADEPDQPEPEPHEPWGTGRGVRPPSPLQAPPRNKRQRYRGPGKEEVPA